MKALLNKLIVDKSGKFPGLVLAGKNFAEKAHGLCKFFRAINTCSGTNRKLSGLSGRFAIIFQKGIIKV
ncbi:hypothetical protein HYY74_06305 [Candidatus Woesearchaeota archaeon]|nr:hypothetical protein [Candidatus Woesearchaeota archaeon]